MITPDVLATTRRSLHGIAELVVAGPQFQAAGTMRLRSRPGGFGTVAALGDVAETAVEGAELVVVRAGDAARWPLAGTFAGLATAAGLLYGGLEGVYAGGSGAGPDDPVEVDPGAAAVLAAAWATGDAALRDLATAAGSPQVPVLWPEHFDIGITLDAVNYGVSPGDETIAEPYAYVGPHEPRQGAFWNQPFGAARPLRDLGDDAAAVLAFFTEGRHQAARA